jgi:hypothetical protein
MKERVRDSCSAGPTNAAANRFHENATYEVSNWPDVYIDCIGSGCCKLSL